MGNLVDQSVTEGSCGEGVPECIGPVGDAQHGLAVSAGEDGAPIVAKKHGRGDGSRWSASSILRLRLVRDVSSYCTQEKK